MNPSSKSLLFMRGAGVFATASGLATIMRESPVAPLALGLGVFCVVSSFLHHHST